jgi:hypothetical protein
VRANRFEQLDVNSLAENRLLMAMLVHEDIGLERRHLESVTMRRHELAEQVYL